MKLKPKITIADHFTQMSDPRIDRTKRHNLIYILTIAICAVICDADSWVSIELYGCTKYEWLKTFLVLNLSGCIVTTDAIGCQKEIVNLIAQQSADYVIT